MKLALLNIFICSLSSILDNGSKVIATVCILISTVIVCIRFNQQNIDRKERKQREKNEKDKQDYRQTFGESPML